MSELNHSGDCSIWISPICDCGILRKIMREIGRDILIEGKPVRVNGASVATQWAAHLTAVDAQRHSFARMDDPDKPAPAPVRINLSEPTGRTIQEEIDEYERTKGQPSAFKALIKAVIGLHCPHCHQSVPVSFET